MNESQKLKPTELFSSHLFSNYLFHPCKYSVKTQPGHYSNFGREQNAVTKIILHFDAKDIHVFFLQMLTSFLVLCEVFLLKES